MALGLRVKSRVMVGNGAEADRVAIDAKGSEPKYPAEFVNPNSLFVLELEPDRSIAAAADVVLAIAVAAGGRGWLWLPS